MKWLDEELGNSLPWIVQMKDDESIVFDGHVESTKKGTTGPTNDWSCYRVKMKNIDSDKIKAGVHEIPFWAMKEWQRVCIESEQEGWITVCVTIAIIGKKRSCEMVLM